MKKVSWISTIVLAIVFLLINFVFLIIPLEKNVSFWLADVFIVVALLVQVCVNHMLDSKQLTGRVFNLPIYEIGYKYLFVQLVVSIFIVLLSKIIPVWFVLFVEAIIIAAYSIVFIMAKNTKDAIEKMEYTHQKQSSFIRSMTEYVGAMKKMVRHEALKNSLQNLEEDFRFSDPVSCEELSEIEREITQVFQELQNMITVQNFTMAIELCDGIKDLLVKRNALCKMYKKKSTDRGSL